MRDSEQEIDCNSAVIAIDLLWTSSGLYQVDSHLMSMKRHSMVDCLMCYLKSVCV